MSTQRSIASRTDLTEGPIISKMIMFALPIIAGNIVMQLYNVTDGIVIGQFVGSDALAAVTVSFPIMMLFNSLFMGLSMGANILISQYRGAKDHLGMERAVNSIFSLCLMVGGVITLLGIFLSRQLLHLMSTPDNILDDAASYLIWIYVGTIGNTVYNMSTGLIRGLGDSRWPLISLIIAALMNVFLDIFFVAVLHMGVAGVAIATAIAQGFSGLVLVSRFVRGKYGFRLSLSSMRKVSMHTVGLIFKLGIPSSIQSVAGSLGMLIVQSFANLFGSNFIAANGIIGRVDGFVMMPMMGIGMAVTTFVGQNIGAGNAHRAKEGAIKSVQITIGLSLLFGVIMYNWGILLLRIFTDNETVLNIGMRGVRFIAFFFTFMGINNCLGGAIRGAGEAKFPAMTAILSNVIRIPTVYLLSVMPLNRDIAHAIAEGLYATHEAARYAGVGFGHYMGMFYSMGITMSMGALLNLLYFLSGKWQTKGVVHRAPSSEP